MSFGSLQKKMARFGIGLMTGTSCDGIDAALIRIKGTGDSMAVKPIAFKSFPYDKEMRTRLLAPRMDARELCALNFELGARLADAAAATLEVAEAEPCEVDFIASSGH